MVKTDSNTALFIKWIVDAFENCSQKTAIIDHAGERETTYEELYIMACRVVGYIDKRRLPAHSFIGICLPTSMEYIAAEIGIWLAGHAIIPMGDQFPESRIQQIMEHSESPLLIDEKVMSEIASTEPKEPSALPGEDDINALFYTSGSTGQPKGVLHSFRSFGIPLFPDKMFQDLDVSVMAVTAPMFFVACKLIYDFITRGKTVNVVPQNIRMDIRKLEDFLAEQRIDFVFIPPSVLPYFQNKSQALKVVFTASERVSGVGPKGYKLVNYCGQTETAGIGCTFMIDKPYDNTPIGIPVEPYIYSVQDEDGNEVHFGEEGELCYRGDLTPGYYKDPERTAQLYRGGWLHTGDIVRARPDGNLIYVNRKDWMVKINGQRVEPSEVETVFKKIPGIDNAIVKGFTSGNKRQYLCGYYISKTGVTEQEIIDYLTSKLPAYMVPVYFVKMESFPLNMNGKTDRKSLQSPAVEDDVIERAPYEAPQNDTEAKLCAAFERTLGHTQVGVNEDFFLMGGDSIRVMKLQTLCADLSIDARMIYTHRTPRRIAEAISKKGEFSFERLADYPLSQTQLGIFAACMARQGEVIYNNSTLFKLAPGLDLPRLAKALEAVVEAHPFVKTRLFINSNGNPRQRRNDDESYRQEIEYVSEEEFDYLKPQLMQPFDLLHDQLFRIRIIATPKNAYLFMDFHHVIFDGMSMGVVLSDLEKAYHGEHLEGESFSGFEVAQEEEALRQTKAYSDAKEWNTNVFGSLEITSLPVADSNGLATTFGKQEADLGLSVQELNEACQRFGVTPNVFTIAVFGYLLGHYTYSQESLFATIYHGRHELRLDRTVSMLVKTLPVYEKWDKQTTLRTLLQTIKEQLMGSMANDIYSFAELRAMNHYIGSQILFAYQGDIEFPNRIGGAPYCQIPLMDNATGEQLAFEISRNGNQLTLHAEYHSNIYSDAFVKRILQSYIHLIKTFAAVDNDEVTLMSLPLLSHEDMENLLTMGCGKEVRRNASETFIQLFKRQVSHTPDAIAVVDKLSSITYAELDRQSDCLAASLVKAGVANDAFVALMLPRRKEFVIAVLAVFKAGGAYLSMDSDYPQARIDFMLNDLNARFLITTSELAEKHDLRSNDSQRHIILLDHFDFSSTVSPLDYSRAQSLAYIIYTSGTTGKPKGVMIEHHSLCAMLNWLIPMEELKAGDKCALHPSFSFDASIPDLFGPLTCGAQIHIISSAMRYDIVAFSRYLTDNQITGLTMSTQIGMELLESQDLSLRYLFLGGENLHVNRNTGVKVINGYGPTEFTVCSSYHVVDPDCTYENIPIGHPVPGSKSLIVGPEGRLVPWGAMGELCLVGPQLARGYWQREQQTRERFVDCPFLPGEKMYRTGDLVKWSQDGELIFHGRIDNQVKINGYRIELGEIESCINSLPGIQTSAVIVNKHNNLQYLMGFYVSDSSEMSPKVLRKSLTDSLPSYMVPSKLVQLERMPMTPNGKIDHRQLTELATSMTLSHGTTEPPSNQREKVLLDIVKTILGIEQVGITDDLTLLGLSSLNAIKLAVLAKEADFNLKVNDILRLKTIKKIAAHKTTVGDWAQGYDASKPVAVVVQGLTSYHLLQPLITRLCQRYSVFVIEPLQEHIRTLFAGKNKSEIVDGYIELIRHSLPADAKVSVFVGHSFGGEFSYRCAVKWHEETNQTPRVLLFDTYFDISKVVGRLHQMEEYINPIEDHSPMPFYSGSVDYFEATQMADKELKSDSDASWRRLLPHLCVHSVSTSHFRLLDTNNVSFCLSQI